MHAKARVKPTIKHGQMWYKSRGATPLVTNNNLMESCSNKPMIIDAYMWLLVAWECDPDKTNSGPRALAVPVTERIYCGTRALGDDGVWTSAHDSHCSTRFVTSQYFFLS